MWAQELFVILDVLLLYTFFVFKRSHNAKGDALTRLLCSLYLILFIRKLQKESILLLCILPKSQTVIPHRSEMASSWVIISPFSWSWVLPGYVEMFLCPTGKVIKRSGNKRNKKSFGSFLWFLKVTIIFSLVIKR